MIEKYQEPHDNKENTMYTENAKMHCLKTWPPFFGAIESGNKLHEIRVDDRGYNEGDILCLQEWDPDTCQYTGRVTFRRVSHITRFSDLSANIMKELGLNPCFPAVKRIVVMSVAPLND